MPYNVLFQIPQKVPKALQALSQTCTYPGIQDQQCLPGQHTPRWNQSSTAMRLYTRAQDRLPRTTLPLEALIIPLDDLADPKLRQWSTGPHPDQTHFVLHASHLWSQSFLFLSSELMPVSCRRTWGDWSLWLVLLPVHMGPLSPFLFSPLFLSLIGVLGLSGQV